jgi:hypothetical protein
VRRTSDLDHERISKQEEDKMSIDCGRGGSPRRARKISIATLLTLAVLDMAPLPAQLGTAGHQRLAAPDAGRASEENAAFGQALAAADFNRDGYDDLAVGAPFEDVGDVADAGVVYVFYGSALGLGAGTTTILHRDVAGVQDVAEAHDHFGAALAAGDFDGDQLAELAVGVPDDDVFINPSTYVNAGSFQVFESDLLEVVPSSDVLFRHLELGVATSGLARLGSAFATCDFDGDGRDDLVVGAPRPGGALGAVDDGRAYRLLGSGGGLSGASTLTYAPNEFYTGHSYGASLACGDLDGLGDLDFAVGQPHGDWGAGLDSGGGILYYASGQAEHIVGSPPGARRSAALAVGRIREVPHAQLFVGAPGADGADDESGDLLILTHDQEANYLIQGLPSTGLSEMPDPFDQFGGVLAVGDFDHDGFDDLVVGVPGENLYDGEPGQKLDAGIVQVIHGSAAGPNEEVAFHQIWSWDTGLSFAAVANDNFGGAVAVGDFDGNGVDDLAIAAPGAEWFSEPGAGAVQILYAWPPGWIFGDDFEAGHGGKWSSSTP